MTTYEENYEYDNAYCNEHIDNQYNDHEEEKTAPSEIPHTTKKSIVFVTLAEIKLLIQGKCREISEVFGISDDEALILLNHFKWRKDALENELLGNEASTYTQAGLEPIQQAELSESPEIICPMCFDTKPKDAFDCLKCNHLICKECWTDFISFQVTKPENAFFWACPYEGCNMKVPNGFNLKYIETSIQPQYYKKMAVAYADNSKSLRWCPAAGCEYGAEVPGLEVRAIECPCGWIYCFKCGLEDHRPCECDIADEWLKKDGESDANDKWLNLYTKNCPKCKKPIEKTYGCNIMRCGNPGCGHTFCWLCLGDYSKHPWCNKYTNISSKEKNKKKLELKKYIFYYERFKNNKMAFDSVDKIIKTVESEKKDLAFNLGLALNQLEFLKEACQVLRNCERILKWSYAYGFYLNNDKQRNIYEIIQEKLDMYSSELYVMLERKYEESKRSVNDFMDFKRNVQAAVFKCKQSSETFLAEQEWLQAGGKEVVQEKKKKFFRLKFGLFRKLLSK